jgi:hypothetical protein
MHTGGIEKRKRRKQGKLHQKGGLYFSMNQVLIKYTAT